MNSQLHAPLRRAGTPADWGLVIGVVAKMCGLTPRAIRLYESRGLLRPGRTAAGVRLYRAADVELLLFIKLARRNGLTVRQVGELVRLQETSGAPAMRARLLKLCEDRLTMLQEQRLSLEDLIRDLRERKVARQPVSFLASARAAGKAP